MKKIIINNRINLNMDSSDTESIGSFDSYQDGINYSRYELGFCDLYHPLLHGSVISDEEEIYKHYLYIMPTTISNSEQIIIQRLWMLQRIANSNGGLHTISHPIIRNYQRYAFHNYHIEPQIVEVIDGPGDFTTAIIKTHYIRLIQRKWKKIYAERQRVLSLRKSPKSLHHRRVYGKWPSSCAKYV